MSSTKSELTKPTYLIEGEYSTTTIEFDLYLPPAAANNPYTFSSAFNVSKQIAENDVNIICFFMKTTTNNQNLSSVNSQDQRFHFSLPINSLIEIENTNKRSFDPSIGQTFVAVIHDEYFHMSHVNDVFDECQNHITNLQQQNCPKFFGLKKDLKKIDIPRIVGVSIITRS